MDRLLSSPPAGFQLWLSHLIAYYLLLLLLVLLLLSSPPVQCSARDFLHKYPPPSQHPLAHTLLALQKGSMKHSSCSHGLLSLLLLFSIVISFHATRASPLPSQPKLGGLDARVDDVTQLGHAAEMDSWEMMQLDKCKEEDEECFKTRMIAEAHLDYIYTQHHKP